jgi:hypothetical protein
MNCLACGGLNPVDAVYCGFCAAALHPDAAEQEPPLPGQGAPAFTPAAAAAGLETAQCAVCGYLMAVADTACPRCGTPRGMRLDPAAALPGSYAPAAGYGGQYDTNTSGTRGAVPLELKGGWNWGAFWYSWIWGLNHKTPITLAALLFSLAGRLVPFLGLVNLGLAVWFGVRGNEWAWQNRRFDSIDHFRAVQRAWAMWVLGSFILVLVLFAIGVAIGLAGALESLQ